MGHIQIRLAAVMHQDVSAAGRHESVDNVT